MGGAAQVVKVCKYARATNNACANCCMEISIAGVARALEGRVERPVAMRHDRCLETGRDGEEAGGESRQEERRAPWPCWRRHAGMRAWP